MKPLEQILFMIWKLFSVRLLVTLGVTFVVCRSMDRALDLITIAMSSGDKELIGFAREIFLFVGGAVIGAFSTITTLYFTRQDRTNLKKLEAQTEEEK